MADRFENLQISKQWTTKLQEAGIVTPSPVQAAAIPELLAGKDAVIQSQTGTGKTLAYLLPIIEQLDADSKAVQAVVLVPTRELGMQIMAEAERLLDGTPLAAISLIGGASVSRQIDKLRSNPQLAIGTPGRVLELITARKLSMHYVRKVVIDEVDQVFALGSMGEVEMILNRALRDRQICFCSATIPESVDPIINRWLNEPVRITINQESKTAETIEHYYFTCEQRDKLDTLRRLVRLYNPRSAIVFINHIDDVAEVVAKMKYVGLSIEALYGEAGKLERTKVMNAFRNNKFQLLLATDVAARGLDLSDVSHVFNLDLPPDADHYVHRVGRTGRMGRKGLAVSIVTAKQYFIVEKFAKALGINFQHKAMFRGKIIDQEPWDTTSAKTRTPQKTSSSTANSAIGRRRKPISATAPRERARKSEQPKSQGKIVRNPKSGNSKELEKSGKNKGAPRWLKDKPPR